MREGSEADGRRGAGCRTTAPEATVWSSAGQGPASMDHSGRIGSPPGRVPANITRASLGSCRLSCARAIVHDILMGSSAGFDPQAPSPESLLGEFRLERGPVCLSLD